MKPVRCVYVGCPRSMLPPCIYICDLFERNIVCCVCVCVISHRRIAVNECVYLTTEEEDEEEEAEVMVSPSTGSIKPIIKMCASSTVGETKFVLFPKNMLYKREHLI